MDIRGGGGHRVGTDMMVGASFFARLTRKYLVPKGGCLQTSAVYQKVFFGVFSCKILNTLFKPPNWQLTPRNVYL